MRLDEQDEDFGKCSRGLQVTLVAAQSRAPSDLLTILACSGTLSWTLDATWSMSMTKSSNATGRDCVTVA